MSNTSIAGQILTDGLTKSGVKTDPEPLMQYLLLLAKWNQTYNLTAIRDIESMVTRHLLDSLAILPWVTGQRILDVGSGAGLPGIPLALTLPDKQFVLLDSNGKKVRFMQEAKRALKLDNLDVVQIRVENYHPEKDFDTVMSRAFSDLKLMLNLTKHLLAPKGKWLAMKGRYPDCELSSIDYPWQVMTYDVAGIDAERCCVVIDNLDQGV
jgi:16S rRNA (guanine527-N7)-methyltransferase